MAYELQYRIKWTNEKKEDVIVRLYKKDTAQVGEVIEFTVVACNLRYEGDENRFFPIIGMNAELSINLKPDEIDLFEIFAIAEQDTWLMTITNDTQFVFRGFVLADQGQVPLQDKPYTIRFTAVDGLSLLKNIDLPEFRNEELLIKILALALKQTGLLLNIRVYDNIYHANMNDRSDDLKWDFFGQAKLDYRTFLKDELAFTDCYHTLEIILSQGYRLFYWQDQWVIIRLELLQYIPFSLCYTVYDANGENAQGFEDLETYATVGKNELVYPINEDQNRSFGLAVRSTQTNFTYTPWPEIPKNNKFERGTLTGSGIAYDDYDLDNDDDTGEQIGTYRTYSIDDWIYGLPSGPDFYPFVPISSPAYRRSVFNDYQVEILREVITENAGGLLCSEIPITKGDRININWSRRATVSQQTANSDNNVAYVFIVGANGQRWSLEGDASGTGETPFIWRNDYNAAVQRFMSTGEDETKYYGVDIKTLSMPVTGNLYIVVISVNAAKTYTKDFTVEYIPYVANGFIPAGGEYWKRWQDKNFADKSDEEIFLSDNDHKSLKGTLLDANGFPFSRDWHRDGISESRHFIELINRAVFNQECRRFLRLTGSFSGMRFAPENDPTNFQPLSFFKVYRFVDRAYDTRCILVAALSMDLITGKITANYYEVYGSPHLDVEVSVLDRNDGQVEGLSEFKYKFK